MIQVVTLKNAIAYGTPTYTIGKVGNAIVLNGTSQYARRDDLAANFVGTSSFTVAGWIKTSSVLKTIWQAQVSNSADTRILCQLNASGKIEVYRVLSGNYDDMVTSSSAYNDNGLHFITVSYDGSLMTLYADATSVTKASIKSLTGYGYAFGIGCVVNQLGTISSYFGGLLDQMRIYNRALSTTEIQVLYNNGTGI